MTELHALSYTRSPRRRLAFDQSSPDEPRDLVQLRRRPTYHAQWGGQANRSGMSPVTIKIAAGLPSAVLWNGLALGPDAGQGGVCRRNSKLTAMSSGQILGRFLPVRFQGATLGYLPFVRGFHEDCCRPRLALGSVSSASARRLYWRWRPRSCRRTGRRHRSGAGDGRRLPCWACSEGAARSRG
jgi:hypothetical protein